VNFADLLRARPGLVGIGVLTFAVIAIISLLGISKGGEHPLALKTDVALCDVLGDEVWIHLQYPASDAVARVPENVHAGMVTCALELEPVKPGDRWARVARGEDADKVRRIATVILSTTATLRQQSPNAKSETYTETFDRELVASGWTGNDIEGPWSWGSVYTLGEDQVATLVEDHGVVLWVTAKDVAPDNMVSFTRSASERIRQDS
jgi:hypothetical protein